MGLLAVLAMWALAVLTFIVGLGLYRAVRAILRIRLVIKHHTVRNEFRVSQELPSVTSSTTDVKLP